MTATSPSSAYARLRRSALLSATMLATIIISPAEAAMYGIVVNQVQDPLLAGLSIPNTAPTQGMFSAVQDWPMNAITLGLLPSGKIASYGSPGATRTRRMADIRHLEPCHGIFRLRPCDVCKV